MELFREGKDVGLGVGGGEELLMGTGVGAEGLDAFLKRPPPRPPRWMTSWSPGFLSGKWDQAPCSPWSLDLCSTFNQNFSRSIYNASEWTPAQFHMRCVEMYCHLDFNILRLPFASHVLRGR